jgi:hypothetical protein
LSVNIKFICTSFRNRQNSEPLASFSGLFRSEYKWILYLTTMYVYCVYPAMSKKLENLSDLNKKDRNKRHSSPFINVVKGVFFVVHVTLVPVSYLSAPSAVHSYRVPGKFIRRLKSLFVGWKVYSSSTNKAKIYSYSIFVQQMYWLQDKNNYHEDRRTSLFRNKDLTHVYQINFFSLWIIWTQLIKYPFFIFSFLLRPIS